MQNCFLVCLRERDGKIEGGEEPISMTLNARKSVRELRIGTSL